MACIIAQGDKYKVILKIALGWARKKLGAHVEVVHEDMMNCGNPVFAKLTVLLNDAADKVDRGYQKQMIREVGELFLWIMYKDTAYRDVAFWMLQQMMDNSEEFKKDLQGYVKDPKDFYVNVWNRTKEHTKQQQEEGKISECSKSFDEEIFTPPMQKKKLERYK